LQHSFFNGRRYFEVDLDLHTYSYLARRAIMSFVTRLPSVIWDNAFVIQVSALHIHLCTGGDMVLLQVLCPYTPAALCTRCSASG
jgi:hypothetical protein